MDFNDFTNYLESGIASAEASQALNQSTPVSRPYKNPDQEIMRWQFQSIKYDIDDKKKKERNMFSTNTTILSGDCHSCKTALEDLKPIKLCDMKVPKVHGGRYLMGQVVGMPFAIVGVNVLIQDLNGDVEELAIYNFRYKLDKLDWINPGTILLIKEPWLRYGSQSKTPSLRIDSPSDVIFVDPTDLEFLEKIGAKQWCEKNI
uniref:Uncharacterized protein n=1 Tax=Panagrolaimus davidi TaxID=227884 RepID=A0A914PSW9_9BILA